MEPSKIFGVTEECHSSESGWTKYIGSPFYGDDENEHSDHHGNTDDDDDDDGSDGDDDGDKGYNHEDDSDDSMASDASSGPSHQGTNNLKHEDLKEGNGVKSQVEGGEKYGKPRGKKKIDDMRRNEEKKGEKVVMGERDVDNASAHPSGSTKVSVQYFWDQKLPK